MSNHSATGYRAFSGYQAGLLGGFSLVAAALLVIGNIATKPSIEQRQAEDLLASLGQVIPSNMHDNDLLANVIRLPVGNGQSRTVYRALAGLEVTAVAFATEGNGYAGPIDLMLGLDRHGEILGVRVLSHAETPGLGDKIEVDRDDWILAFNGLSLRKTPLPQWSVKKDGGRFDQFSGATITPRAVVSAVKQGLLFFRDHQDALLASAVIRKPAVAEPSQGDHQ